MKVELDNVTLGYSTLSDSVFAGTNIKPGIWRHKVNVTQAFFNCVIQMWEGKKQSILDGEHEWEVTVKKIK